MTAWGQPMDSEYNYAETKKCIKCRMDIPVDAEKCPYCRSSQKPTSFGKVFLWIIIIAALAYGGWYAFTQYKISGVKNGYLSDYSKTVTVGTALDSFFGNPKWKYGKDSDGTEVVSVTGECTYNDQPAEATVQFSILDSGKRFIMSGMKINGQDLGLLSNLAFAALYEKALESAR